MEIAVAKVLELIEHLRMLDAENGDGRIEGEEEDVDFGAGHLHEDIDQNGGEAQVRGVIEALNVDEQADLVALLWVGRGDYEPEEWPAALRRAHERRIRSTAAYLMGIPNAGDLLEEGLAAVAVDA
ncbi:MAG: DUF3775 domain-containing protein [Hyphomicrobiales bacterium]|nr:DUF3775 domain-containing protein [Hyphomicrobiales bacterium]